MCLEDLNASELFIYLSGQYAALLFYRVYIPCVWKKRDSVNGY